MSRKARLEVEYTYELEPEYISVRGNAMASGDPAVDREAEDWVFAELEQGNDAAWASAHVRAVLTFTVGDDVIRGQGDAYLGACSYRSEKELWESMINDYDLEGQARADAAVDLGRMLSSGSYRLFNAHLKKLERSETLKHLMARQARATKAIKTDPQWAQSELVRIDEELEKL